MIIARDTAAAVLSGGQIGFSIYMDSNRRNNEILNCMQLLAPLNVFPLVCVMFKQNGFIV